jgi:hypothetical protein
LSIRLGSSVRSGDPPVESTGFRYCSILFSRCDVSHKFTAPVLSTGASCCSSSSFTVDCRLSTLLQSMLVYSMVVDSLDKALDVLLLLTSSFNLLPPVSRLSRLSRLPQLLLTVWLPVCTSPARWDSIDCQLPAVDSIKALSC